MDDRAIGMNLRDKVMGGPAYPQVDEQKRILEHVLERLQSGDDLADSELDDLNAQITQAERLNARVRKLAGGALQQ